MRKNIVATLLVFTLFANMASAADVEARLSSREAYVGSPITLQLAIADADDVQRPEIPEIDGCEIRAAGTPSQSTQVTIINGRRSVSRSVTLRYLITPLREGTFEIPSFSINVDGQAYTVQSRRFVATKSVAGDLLFVEIEGGKKSVFVGQPLDLTLKLWIKPYRDGERNLTLSEGDMWNMISDQSSWGGFASRIKELAENNQRPRGQEVLRDDGQGNERSYYMYEIDATVYPKRAGKIDANDVKIVVNYPTALGESRSPLDSMFDDGPFGGSLFGGRSPFPGMNDDFFGSPFRKRLAVTSVRPITGEVSVDATEVRPVPTEGRPDDYRGAVGRYRIVTQVAPTTVDAGDPITLNIGIAGTGPMELVQAPPLTEMASLTADFKVADQSLAGFVQDDTKVFSTTIRPKREGISEVPPIRFSFFDPETEKFETVMSDPIAITVNKSEMLALNSIIGHGKSNNSHDADTTHSVSKRQPDFTNNHSAKMLASEPPVSSRNGWWVFVLAPAVIWFITWIVWNRSALSARVPSLRSARGRCLATIRRAQDSESIAEALTQYIGRRSGNRCTTASEAIGVLRIAGAYTLASEVESYLDRTASHRAVYSEETNALEPAKDEAIALTNKIESELVAMKNFRVRIPKTQPLNTAISHLPQRSLGFLLALATLLSAGNVVATEAVKLTRIQQQTILAEAGAAYTQATALSKSDAAEAKELLQTAANKYQLLVDSGIHNAGLYTNLGNACLQSGELGRAIVNYERALQFEPGNRQVAMNLEFANSLVKGVSAPPDAAASFSFAYFTRLLQIGNTQLVQLVGLHGVQWTLAVTSLIFWGLLTARTVGCKLPVWRIAAFPALLMLVALGSLMLVRFPSISPRSAVIVANEVSLHAGDGEQFDRVFKIDAAQGHHVEVLASRGTWTQIRTANGHTGWVSSQNVEKVEIANGKTLRFYPFS